MERSGEKHKSALDAEKESLGEAGSLSWHQVGKGGKTKQPPLLVAEMHQRTDSKM